VPAQLAARLRALFGKHGGQELDPFRHPSRASERKEGRALAYQTSVLSETAGARFPKDRVPGLIDEACIDG
jgi:hypothetical protein